MVVVAVHGPCSIWQLDNQWIPLVLLYMRTEYSWVSGVGNLYSMHDYSVPFQFFPVMPSGCRAEQL